MRRAASRKAAPGQGTAQTYPFPAPVGGLNLRDPRASVPVTEALTMLGMFPSRSGVILGKGATAHTTSAGTMETLMVYTANTGTETLFGAASTAIYNVTSAGARGASVVSGLTNARWQHINYTNSSGTAYLCAFNGADSPRYWNGSAWTAITDVSTPAITGVTTTTLISAAVHQRRMWLVQVDSLKAWYLPVDSVGGAAQALDLGGIATRGGDIMAIESWTVDGGAGIDDYWVCITSEGQVIAYQGTDPSSASTWEHVGTWNIAEPVGRRCLYQYKGDILIITTTGIASLRRVMSGDTSSSGMLTDKIVGGYASAIAAVGSSFGWQLLYYAKADMLVLSPPGYFWVYAMNTLSGAWGALIGGGARCWALFNGEPYFAWGAVVQRYWDGYAFGGETVSGGFVQGYSEMDQPGITKKASIGRVVMAASGDANVGMEVVSNYDNASAAITVTQTLTGGVDGITPWFPLTGNGTSLAVTYSVQSANSVEYSGAYVVYQSGSLMGAPPLP